MTRITRRILIAIFILGVIVPGCVLGAMLLILAVTSGGGAMSLAFRFYRMMMYEVYFILFVVIPLLLCVAVVGYVYSNIVARRQKAEQE